MKTVWQKQNAEGMKTIMDFNEGYRQFLSKAKTEREFVNETVKVVEAQGFINAEKLDSLKTGDKIIIRIWDNGIGFLKEKIKPGIGLKNINERTKAMNGDLIIISKIGEGTTIEIVI